MPLAFDLTSTLVIGVTLPVATTLLARSPRSTLASFEGSILVPPLLAAITPTAISSTIPNTTLLQTMTLRRFFLLFPLPFTTPPVGRWRLAAIAPSLPITWRQLHLFLRIAACDAKIFGHVAQPGVCQLDPCLIKRIARILLESGDHKHG